MSVITEPDASNLNVPEKQTVKEKDPVPNVKTDNRIGKVQEETVVPAKDISNIIDNTFKVLEKDIVDSYTAKEGKTYLVILVGSICCSPTI